MGHPFLKSRKAGMENKFKEILMAVSEVMGMTQYELLCKRRYKETTDARWIVVQLMIEDGFYPNRIADHLSMTIRNVHHIIFGLAQKLDRGDARLQCNLERARKCLINIRETSSCIG